MRKVVILSLVLLVTQACRSVSVSEAAQQGQGWFDKSFTKCGGDYFARYAASDKIDEDQKKRESRLRLTALNVSEFGTVKEGVFQFKNITFNVEDKPVTATEKLNGLEAKAVGSIRYTQFRYYDGEKWSLWNDIPLTYSSELMEMATKMLGVPNSPMFVTVERSKGKWGVNLGHWTNVACSDLPSL